MKDALDGQHHVENAVAIGQLAGIGGHEPHAIALPRGEQAPRLRELARVDVEAMQGEVRVALIEQRQGAAQPATDLQDVLAVPDTREAEEPLGQRLLGRREPFHGIVRRFRVSIIAPVHVAGTERPEQRGSRRIGRMGQGAQDLVEVG